MTLRTKTLLTIGALLLSLMVIVYIGSRQVVLTSFARLEEQVTRDNTSRITRELDETLDELKTLTTNYAQRDETYAYMQKADDEFIKSHFTPSTFKNSHLNIAILAHANGEAAYATGFDTQRDTLIPIPEHLMSQLQPGQPMYGKLNQPYGMQGIVMLPDGPMMVVSQPILGDDGKGLSRGFLVFGRYLGDSSIDDIGRRIGAPFTIRTIGSITSTAESSVLQTLLAGGISVQLDETTVSGYTLVRDVFDQPAFVAHTAIPRAIYFQGQNTFLYFLIILLAVGLIYEAIVLLFLEKSVLARLARLSHSVGQIAGSGDTQARVVEGGNEGSRDELGVLASTINMMLETLALNHRVQVENASWFKMLVDQSPSGVYIITDQQFTYVNHAAAEIFGFTPEDIAWNISPLDNVHPDDQSMVKEKSLAYNNSAAETASYTMRGLCNDEHMIYCAIEERRIMWKGRSATLGIVANVTERKTAQDNLQKRERILEAINVAARRFLKGSDWEDNVDEVLDRLGTATQVDHVYVFKNRTLPDGTTTTIHRYTWSKPSAGAVPSATQRNYPAAVFEIRYRADGFEDWEDGLSQNRMIKCNVKDFTPEQLAVFGKLRVNSILAVPVFVEQDWWGFVGFADNRLAHEWTPSEEDALKLFASLLGAAIERKHAEEQIKRLYEVERQRRRLAEALNETGTALNATLNFNSILDCLLDQVQRIIPYDLGFIMLVQDGRARVARVRQSPTSELSVRENIENSAFDIGQTANLRWMAENGQPLVIPDTSYYPEYMPASGLEQIGSWVQAPIMAGGIAIGYLFLGKQEPNIYSSETAAYVAPFASQTAFAMQNARLYADASESLARERRYNEIVRAISSSLDLPVILRNVAYLATDLVKADAASMGLINENGEMILTTYATRPSLQIPERALPQDTGITWQVMKDKTPLLVLDYANHPSAEPDHLARGVRTMIAVPIVAGELQLGVLELFTVTADKQFNGQDVAVVEAVGKQAGMAIQKARLLDDAHRRAQEAETLRQAGAAIASSLQLHETFERILEQLEHVVPYDTASIQLLRKGYLEIVDGRGWPDPSKVIGVRFALPGNNPNYTAVQERHPVLLTHAAISDPSTGKNIQSWLGIPLIIHDKVIGMLTVDSYTLNRFNTDHIRLASAFADHVAVAIENAQLFEKVQQFAMTDELTGLHNRRHFFELAEKELDRAKHTARSISVLMIDIDRFKRVNDTYGHLAGDQVLREVANRCRCALRAHDLLARYGGEEFVALLPLTRPTEAQDIAERLRLRVGQEPVLYKGEKINIAVSVGVANLDNNNCKLETLLIRADEAQYIAKNAGGNQLVTWQSDMAA